MSAAAHASTSSSSSSGWAVVGVLWQRDLVHFSREPGRIAAALGQPVLFWLLLGSGFGRGFSTSGMSYLEYFFPGMVLLVVLFASIFATITVIEDRQQGFLRAVLAAPVPRDGVLLGKALGSATLAFAQGALVLALAPAARIPLHAGGLAAACVATFLVAYTLSALGIALAWVSGSTASFHAGMNFLLMPLWLLSGALFPVAGAPLWLAWLMHLDPLTYGLEALRTSLYFPNHPPGGGTAMAPALAWIVCAAFALIAHWVATLALRARSAPASA